jgi:predicted AlkP superfamily pyrophosphatase or phosphodiesterase
MTKPLSRAATACLFAALLAACASLSDSSSRAARPHAPGAGNSVLLVSLDGFRADFLDLGITPNLSRIAREGVRARWMTPAYPTLTFPNHYSMVTGLLPDRHGIVHNTMRDAALGGFKLSDRDAVGDGRWWGGEPIWVGAEQAGLPSATLFWPGSEAAVGGVRPTRWRAFDADMPLQARVDTVVGWLSEPDATRPRIATLYFETIDHDAHDHGPDSPQAREAVRTVDAAIGRLLDGLAATGRLDRTDLVVVSDHGMATVPPGHSIAVEDVVSKKEAEVITLGQVVNIVPKAGFEAQVERKLLSARPQFDCWHKDALPARWRYGSHPRIAPIVCQMREGWDMVTREVVAVRPAHDRGSHGYDPALPSMRALFVARGPSFKSGAVLEPFDNVDVYPLLTRLLGIVPAPNDGDIAPLLPALRDHTDTP